VHRCYNCYAAGDAQSTADKELRLSDQVVENAVRPVVLIVMDGYGCNPDSHGNAIAQAHRPVLSHLWDTCPHTELHASGLAVGLPDGQMGNSEVGHLNLGAGKVVYQDTTRISAAIADGTFSTKPELLALVRHAESGNGSLHIIGLVGRGGVHANDAHLYALLDLAAQSNLSGVYVHVITDGRDSRPTDGLSAVHALQEHMQRVAAGEIATVSGRYYAMDRDGRWDRTRRSFDAMVLGQGEVSDSAETAIQRSYDQGITDEFVAPTVIERRGLPVATIRDGDAVIFSNFRTDRPRQLVRALSQSDFNEFQREQVPRDLYFVTMTQYDQRLHAQVAFRSGDVPMPLARVIADAGLRQLHAAETEKYAHVTFFFNGGREGPFPGEDRILVPSPRDVGTYDKKPEMSADGIVTRVSETLATRDYDFCLVNFANADMVGHTGVIEAAIRAVETVDRSVGAIVDVTRSLGGVVLITADHGNAEQMIDSESGGPYTAHTVEFPVPFLLVPADQPALASVTLRVEGVLADVAPTVLDLMGLSKPPDMEGSSLLIHNN